MPTSENITSMRRLQTIRIISDTTCNTETLYGMPTPSPKRDMALTSGTPMGLLMYTKNPILGIREEKT